jgi:site-specific DNA-methyltransferase (adenine-specific)
MEPCRGCGCAKPRCAAIEPPAIKCCPDCDHRPPLAGTPYFDDGQVQLWLGDCREVAAWLDADVLVTDPPYGTASIGWDISYGRGQSRRHGQTHRPPGVIAGDESTETRDEVLSMWQARGPVMMFGSPRRAEPPGDWTDRLVWDKREPGMNGGAWRYTHESIFVSGEGWTRTSAANFSVISVPSGNGTAEKSDHVHAKPVRLMLALVATAPHGTIADPFAGSGSTLVAAKQLGRRAIGVEIDERYCEIAARRLAQGVLDFEGTA